MSQCILEFNYTNPVEIKVGVASTHLPVSTSHNLLACRDVLEGKDGQGLVRQSFCTTVRISGSVEDEFNETVNNKICFYNFGTKHYYSFIIL